MKKTVIAGFSLSLLIAWAGISIAPAALAEEIIIGTGSVGDTYFQTGRAICALVNRKAEGLTCSVRIPADLDSSGSVFNIDNVSSGALEFGVVQSDIHYFAVTKSGPLEFVDRSYDDIRSVFSVHGALLTIVARRDSGIRTLDDLKGKRVNIGDPGSPQRKLMDAVMAAKGWTRKDFSLVDELPASQQSLSLCHNQVQAAVYLVGHPESAIDKLAALCDAVIVAVAGPEVDKLVAVAPYLAYATIPGGIYENNPDGVTTIGFKATIVSSADVDAEIVYRVVKAVFENLDQFKRMHPALATLKTSAMITEGLTAPLHEGALRHFTEIGIM